MSSTSPPQTLLTPIENNDLASLTSAIQISGTPSPPILDDLLAHAITKNALTTLPYLISLGASPLSDPPFNHLYNPNTFPSFRTLIEHNLLDINTDLEPLGTFLILAVQRSDKPYVQFCLQHGADPNQGTYASRWSPLATAAEYDAGLDVVELLIAAGADVDGSDALHTAAERGRLEMIEFLIGRGTDVNVVGFEYCLSDSKRDEAGTALHFAVDGNSVGAAKILVEGGADITVLDVNGRTAVERAREKGMSDVRLYLERIGGKGK